MRAIWKGRTVAESNDTVVVDGNHYFPRDALEAGCFVPNAKRTRCGWKGEAHYFDVVVDGAVNPAAAWTYPQTEEAAESIRGRVAFWGGVEVVE